MRAILESSTALALWAERRSVIAEAIERHATDLKVLDTLFALLGTRLGARSLVPEWQQRITDGRELFTLLDRILLGELTQSTGFLTNRDITARLSRAWRFLEDQFRPDEKTRLADLRDQLVREANEREIDLRDSGI